VDLPKAIVSMAIEIVDLRYKMLDLSIVFLGLFTRPTRPGIFFEILGFFEIVQWGSKHLNTAWI
jgi:hypothetical protein